MSVPAGRRGLVLVDKPAGLTSHDVIARLRRIYGVKRIGHAGTLDPEATGLLVVAIGNIARLLDYFQAKTKRYVGEVVFGVETDSYDSSGAVISRSDVNALDVARLEKALASMTGEISQRPPAISALKVKGKKLYEYHRESQQVEIKPRMVHIYSISYSKGDEPNVIRIEVVCSPGTYIRSIAHDLGQALDTGAHLRNLRRLQSGSFGVDEAHELDEIEPDTIMDPASALRDFRLVGVEGAVVTKAMSGSRVTLEGEQSDQLILFNMAMGALAEWDQLIGLFRRESAELYRASVVLPVIN
ncbi:MAG: tRNA pseudouridine(55) synthase TruB [Actinomycetota bacterium]|nr:tRNA pseudouridine(55) synthase TruB [Actinomycetota bacterium]